MAGSAASEKFASEKYSDLDTSEQQSDLDSSEKHSDVDPSEIHSDVDPFCVVHLVCPVRPEAQKFWKDPV